ncbi:hypothetical protein [Lonsdalea quercina]|uniref:hypothetical protein n=1 Tax=Lonsdalea quercina TaxID=71657 RepID=UPI0039771544
MDDLNEQFDQTVDYLPLPAVQKYGVKPVTDYPGMLPHFPGTFTVHALPITLQHFCAERGKHINRQMQ